MADVTLTRVPFPAGTSVGLYLARAQMDGNSQPFGAQLAAATVSATSAVTFEDLRHGERYTAAAQIAGAWRSLDFFAGLDDEATGNEAQEHEVITGIWRFANGLKSSTPPTEDDDVVRFAEIADFARDPIGVRLMGRLQDNLADGTVLFLGDSTGAEVVHPDPYPRKLARWWADRLPWITVLYFYWNETAHDYNAPETFQTGTGTHTGDFTLRVYNGCASGERTHYHLAPWFDTIVTTKQPDLVFIGHGHNQGNVPADQFRNDIICLAESVRKACPGCELVVQMENPHFFTDDGVHTDGQRDLVRDQYGFALTELARDMGYGLVNIWQRFFDECDNDEQAIMALLDPPHLHPLEDGQLIWTDEITDHLRITRGLMPRTQPPPALTVPGHNYFTDPLIEDWSPMSLEVDQSGNGHNATGSGGIVTGSDADTKFAGYQSTAFDGTDDALLVPFEPYVTGQPFMFTATVKRTDSVAGHGIFGAENPDGPLVQLVGGADTVRFDPRRLSGGVANWASANTPATWDTYVGYYDGANASLYRDGVLVSTQAVGEAFDTTPGNLRIGEAGNTTTFFKGKMQFVALWSNYLGGAAGAAALSAAIETDPDGSILAANPTVYFPLNSPNVAGDQPTHWILDNATTSKDTTNYETGTWSARMTATVLGGPFSMRQKLFENDIRALRGGWATICARVRVNVDEDNAGFAARVAFTQTAPSAPTASFSNSVQTGLLGFKWIAASTYVQPDATALTCWLFGNRTSHAVADASWDRAGVYRGKILRDPELIPPT